MGTSTDQSFYWDELPGQAGRGVYLVAGEDVDLGQIDRAAELLGREVRFVDEEGYEREIIGAAVDEESGRVAFVECRARDVGSYIDIDISVHLGDRDDEQLLAPIESYNPYFGCDVRLLRWFGTVAVLIYREKHGTYVCAFGSDLPIRFVRIADEWILRGPRLAYRNHYESWVRCLRLPELTELPDLSREGASLVGLLPEVL